MCEDWTPEERRAVHESRKARRLEHEFAEYAEEAREFANLTSSATCRDLAEGVTMHLPTEAVATTAWSAGICYLCGAVYAGLYAGDHRCDPEALVAKAERLMDLARTRFAEKLAEGEPVDLDVNLSSADEHCDDVAVLQIAAANAERWRDALNLLARGPGDED